MGGFIYQLKPVRLKSYRSVLSIIVFFSLATLISCHKKEDKKHKKEDSVQIPEKVVVSPSVKLKAKEDKARKKGKKATITVKVDLKPLGRTAKDLREHRRDPFYSSLYWFDDQERLQSKKESLKDFGAQSYRYVGYLEQNGKAQALLEDPAGIGYMVKVGNVVGRESGTVDSITQTQVAIKSSKKGLNNQMKPSYVILKMSK